MITLILIFTFLVLWHFVYQSILLPTIRLKLRFELFKIRDKIRNLKISYNEGFPDEAFRFTESSINSLLLNLHFLEFSTLFEAKRIFNSDKKVAARIEKIEELFSNCSIEEINKSHSEISNIFIFTLLANSGSWIIFIIPVALIALTFSGIKRIVEKMVFLNDKDYDRILNNKDIALT